MNFGNYIHDRAKDKQLWNDVLSEKLLCEPYIANIPDGVDPIEYLDSWRRTVKAGTNHTWAITHSLPDGQIWSPYQKDFFNHRFLQNLSLTSSLKGEPVNLLEQPQDRVSHPNSNNSHDHLALLAIRDGAVISFNSHGRWKEGFMAAQEKTSRELGMVPADHPMLYPITRHGKVYRVIPDRKKIAEQKKDQLFCPGMTLEWVDDTEPDEAKKRKKLRFEQLKRTKSEIFRGTLNPGQVFREKVLPSYPGGPPGKDGLNNLTELLKRNNMCIRPGTEGGLVLVYGRDPYAMKLVDQRWKKPVLEMIFGLKGGWTLGLPEAQQVRGYAPEPEWMARFVKQQHKNGIIETEELPWQSFNVEIRELNSTSTLRRHNLSKSDLDELRDKTLNAIQAGNTPTAAKRRKAITTLSASNVTIRPRPAPGHQIKVISGIPERSLQQVLSSEPAVLMKSVNIHGEVEYHACFVLWLNNEVGQRWKYMNAANKWASDRVKGWLARGFSDALPMPGLPHYDPGRGQWALATIDSVSLTQEKQARVSEIASQSLRDSFVELCEAELNWWKAVAMATERLAGMPVGSVAKSITTLENFLAQNEMLPLEEVMEATLHQSYGLEQKNPYAWVPARDVMKEAKSSSSESRLLDEAYATWLKQLNETTDVERKKELEQTNGLIR